jgi:cytoskeletal protein CcmA (bactofilin family)
MAENLLNAGYRADGWGAPAAGLVTEQATIGASIVIKGEVSGSEPLFIDGTVEGSVHCPEHRVTVGRNSHGQGRYSGARSCRDGLCEGQHPLQRLGGLARRSNIQGEIVTRRIRIDDGAMLKGSVEIQRVEKGAQASEELKNAAAKPEAKTPIQAPAAETGPANPEPSKAEVLSAAAARRVAGSSVLFKPVR